MKARCTPCNIDGMPSRRVMHVVGGGDVSWRADDLTPEEPLEIRLDGTPVSVTMRTPGDDFDLAVGFLITEGIVKGADEILDMRMCPHASEASGAFNVVEVRRAVDSPAPPSRASYISSSCGICGRASIEAVRTQSLYEVGDDRVSLSPAVLASLPERLRGAQRVFARTGGLHAAGLFTAAGELVVLREDVGRHNAFDKVIGWAGTRHLLPLRSHVILASGRASFELTQKALMAGIPVLAAVSAPSALAVQLAVETGMTLIGFLRGEEMNVYAGHGRITTREPAARSSDSG